MPRCDMRDGLLILRRGARRRPRPLPRQSCTCLCSGGPHLLWTDPPIDRSERAEILSHLAMETHSSCGEVNRLLCIGTAPVGSLHAEEAIDTIIDWGFNAIDWQIDSDLRFRPDAAGNGPERLSPTGLLSVLCVSNVHDVEQLQTTESACQPDFVDPDALSAGIAAVDLAGRLGAPYVREYLGCHSPGALQYRPGLLHGWRDQVRRTVRAALPILSRADQVGTVLCVEPHPRQSIFDLEGLELAQQLAAESGFRIGLAFDPANLIAAGQDPVAFLRELLTAPEILHLKDVETSSRARHPIDDGWRRYGTGKHVRFLTAGDGEVDWPAVTEELLRLGFDGPAVLELEDSTLDLATSVARGRAFAERIASTLSQN